MAKLPNASNAVIDAAKVADYLLNEDHPIGAAKARKFLDLGFSRSEPETFVLALLNHCFENNVLQTHHTKYGI